MVVVVVAGVALRAIPPGSCSVGRAHPVRVEWLPIPVTILVLVPSARLLRLSIVRTTTTTTTAAAAASATIGWIEFLQNVQTLFARDRLDGGVDTVVALLRQRATGRAAAAAAVAEVNEAQADGRRHEHGDQD